MDCVEKQIENELLAGGRVIMHKLKWELGAP